MAAETCGGITDRQGRELKKHGTPLFPVACYEDHLAEAAVPWHWHEELEVVAVTSGAAVVSADGGSCTVGQGDGFFINAGALHSAWDAAGSHCCMHSVVFHPRLVGGGMDSIFWQGYLQPVLANSAGSFVRLDRSVRWTAEALEAVEAAWQACAAERPGYEFRVRGALSQLIFLLADHQPPPRSGPSEKALRDAERIKCMLQYVQEHYGEALTTAQIAGSALISESECLRCFRSMIGATPIGYVRQFRIRKAAELLLATDRKIAEIGALCGFQEMSYFAKTFRAVKGCTPGAFRLQGR